MLFQGSAKGDDAELTMWPADPQELYYSKLQKWSEAMAAFMCYTRSQPT